MAQGQRIKVVYLMNLKSGSLTQHGGQGIYWLDFTFKGVRYRETSHTVNRDLAIAWADRRVAQIQMEVLLAQAAEHTLKEVIEAYLASLQNSSTEKAEMGAFFSEWWGLLRISEIGSDFKDQLNPHFNDAQTLNLYTSFMMDILHFAHQNGWLKKIPK